METEKEKILRMLAEKKISQEEAERMLSTMEEVPPSSEPPEVGEPSPAVGGENARIQYTKFIIANVIALVGLNILFLSVIPRTEEIYRKQNLVLPFLTQMVLSISNLFATFWWIGIVLSLMILGTFCGLYYAFPRFRKFTFVVYVFYALLILVVGFSVLIPLMGLIQRVGEGTRKPF